MENNRWKNLRCRRSIKVAVFLILCACAAGIMLSGAGIALCTYFGVGGSTSLPLYTQTEAFERRLENEAHVIESYYNAGNIEEAEVQYSVLESNVQYILYQYNRSSGTFKKLSSTNTNTEYELQKEVDFGVLQQGFPGFTQYYYKGDLAKMPARGYNGYRVRLFLREGLPVNDSIRTESNAYEFLKNYVPSQMFAILALCLFAVIFILLTVMELKMAGYHDESDHVRLSWFDRVPMDLLTVIWLVIGSLMMSFVYDARYLFLRGNSNPDVIALIAVGITVLAWFLIFVWLMSLAVRVKSGTLIRNNLWYRVFEGIVFILKEYSFPMNVIFLLIMIWNCMLPLLLGRHFLSSSGLLLLFMIGLGTDVILFSILRSEQILLKTTSELSEGNLNARVNEEECRWMFASHLKHARALNSLASGMEIAVNRQMQSERMKTELITNVSHDIKTPLTSIINYTDLLQKEHTEEQGKEYLEALARQSQRLKKLTEDIVEVSKASSGTITPEMTRTDVNEILHQSAGEYEERFNEQNLVTVFDIPDGLAARADGSLLWRVMSNLLSNVQKYAMPGTRVYITAKELADKKVCISVKNISREPLNISAEELMERFVRGDESRHSEGSGLGLSIARSLVDLMNGSFNIVIDGDLFRADIVLEEAE